MKVQKRYLYALGLFGAGLMVGYLAFKPKDTVIVTGVRGAGGFMRPPTPMVCSSYGLVRVD